MTRIKNHRKITVEITTEIDSGDIDLSRLKKLARTVCGQYEITSAVINVILTDDSATRRFHKRFFGSSKTTDVISFDMTETGEKTNLYDILINIQQARRQAAVRGHSVEAETALYLVHGLLHQLGCDDNTAANARDMHRQEDLILQGAGFGKIFETDLKG